MDSQLYFYKANLLSVYDGDTCRVDIDLGMHIWNKNERIRLARIDAPELRGETLASGRAARDFLGQLLVNRPLIIETIKDTKEKYGRYLAEIWFQDDAGTWQNANNLMVQTGHARFI